MRGKPGSGRHGAAQRRNIPAHAGKTLICTSWGRCHEEHPRACGENATAANLGLTGSGTSPRMRGKPWSPAVLFYAFRNIPAHAGKTVMVPGWRSFLPEHPRACGENPTWPAQSTAPIGTSPRMRGKPIQGGFATRPIRNIPAHAGKTCVVRVAHGVN